MKDDIIGFINFGFYAIITLFGIMLLLFTGYYLGSTVKENDDFFTTPFDKHVSSINNRLLYTEYYTVDRFQEMIEKEKKVITIITLIMMIVSISFIELGYKFMQKYDKNNFLRLKNVKIKDMVID